MPAGENVRGAMTAPYLESFAERGGPAERVPLVRTPFVIGRSATVDHTVYSSKVSKEHAVIDRFGDRYLVTDLVSTNGTFVNGRRTVEAFLRDGDIIHGLARGLTVIECFDSPRQWNSPSAISMRTGIDKPPRNANGSSAA